MIHEHTGQAITDCSLHQRCRHCGIHATGESTNGSAFRPHLLLDLLDQLLGDVARRPGGLQAGRFRQESTQDLLAMR